MTKMFLTSATGLALMTGVVTSVCFGSGIYQMLNQQVEVAAQKLATDHKSELAIEDKENLMVALLVGQVANATSEEKAIRQHKATQMIISDYSQSAPHEIYSASRFNMAD